MKKLVTILFLITFNKLTVSQTGNSYHTTKLSGYRIWELRYDSITNIYLSDRHYILSDVKRFSELVNTRSSASLCNDKKLIRKDIRTMRRRKTDPIDSYYFFTVDSAMGDVFIKGDFYKGDSSVLYLAYKVYVKAIVMDNLCSEFENSRPSRCGTPYTKPYIYQLKNIRTERISKEDMKILGWSGIESKTIKWITCH